MLKEIAVRVKVRNISIFNVFMKLHTIATRENFGREKLANHELFAKVFLTVLTDTPKCTWICTDCSLFPKLFLTNSFHLYGLPKFSSTKYFPCTVLHMNI